MTAVLSSVCAQDKIQPVIQFLYHTMFRLERGPDSLQVFLQNNAKTCATLNVAIHVRYMPILQKRSNKKHKINSRCLNMGLKDI